jgi:hypothetical protein
MSTLLIVAPTAALTASIRFVLEAEDYDVTATTSLANAGQVAVRFDCTIVDHHVLPPGEDEDAVKFLKAHQPVVLLANNMLHPSAKWSYRTLTKPLLGAALSQAVREAVASGPR